MSAQLFEIVETLGLQPGDVYRAEKCGRKVEVRVLEEDERPELAESVMLNIIANYPPPEPGVIIRAQPGTIEPSPRLDVPEDEDQA